MDLPSSEQSSRPRHARSHTVLIVLLVVACLMLGAVSRYAILQRQAAGELSDQLNAAQLKRVIRDATTNDLQTLLANPQTRIIRLADGVEGARYHATVLLNDRSSIGFLFPGNLPPVGEGAAYQLIGLRDQDTRALATFRSVDEPIRFHVSESDRVRLKFSVVTDGEPPDKLRLVESEPGSAL